MFVINWLTNLTIQIYISHYMDRLQVISLSYICFLNNSHILRKETINKINQI
jgi:uncharacterized protein Smg (DUF494 family)